MSESIWKKEIHLRKPKADKAVKTAEPKAEEPKKKKRFGRKRKPLPPFPAHLLDAQRKPLPPFPAHLLDAQRTRAEHTERTVVVPVVPQADPEPVQRVERWTTPAPVATTFPRTVGGASEPQSSLLPARPAPDPVVPEPTQSVAPEPERVWSFAPAPEPEPQSTIPEPEHVWSFAPAAEPEAQPEVSEPEPVAPEFVWSFAPAAEPEAQPEVSEPMAEAVDVPSQAPLTFAAPEPEPATPQPMWSLAAPESEAEPMVPEPVADTPDVPSIAPAGVAAPEPAAVEKVPLLKREISFKRKPKAAKPPKQQEAKKQDEPKASKAKRDRRKPSLKRAGKRDHKVTRVVGLRIGSSQLAAAHVQNNGTHELVQLARKPIDRGLVVGGEVRDVDALTRQLKDFFASNKLPRKDVRLGIASNRIGVRVLDVPASDDPKLFENAIRFRAQELLPIPVTDAILDHVILGETTNDEGGVLRRVLLVFAHRELVARFVDVCRGAGIRLSGVDLDAFGLLRAVGGTAAEGTTGHAVVAVAIGHERTVLAVSDGSICDFTRVLEWGGSSLDVAIARALNLSPSQAEPVKHLLDLSSEVAPDGLAPVQFEAAKAAAVGEIGALGRELVSSLRFYQSRPDSLAIGEVLLAGGAAQLRGLPAELQRLLGAPVRIADPFARVTLGKKVKAPENAASLAIAVGLGIEA